MLLMKLNTKEKFSFLQLAHYLARIDNEYGDKEHQIILEYCAEMGIENDEHFEMDEFDLSSTLKDFKTLKSKKIVILELMILIHADDKFDLKEMALISQINEVFKLKDQDLDFCSQWGKAVAAQYHQGIIFIEN